MMAEVHDILKDEPLSTVVIENNGDTAVSNATITGGDGTVVEVLAFDREEPMTREEFLATFPVGAVGECSRQLIGVREA
jgi:hypothetical protein